MWLERHQVALYIAALALGALLGLTAPAVAEPAQLATVPLLLGLLYATFLAIPFRRLGAALQDVRFLGATLILNFVVVPAVVWLLSRIVAHDQVLLVGVLFVLLTPCVDYVIVFAKLAGGDAERLLASTPLLMLAQMLLLPVYLRLFVGSDLGAVISWGPFLNAFLTMIVAPLTAAILTQFLAARFGGCRLWQRWVGNAMVPLLMLTLIAVVSGQLGGVGAHLGSLALAVPVYVLFAVVMTGLGALAGRLAKLETTGTRSLVFSGVTRNSLVVLPLTLALPASHGLVPMVVVTQTLVELVVMVLLVRLLPRLVA